MLSNIYFDMILGILALSILTWIVLTVYTFFARNRELRRCDLEREYWYRRLKRAQFHGNSSEVNYCYQKIAEVNSYQAFWQNQ